MVENTPVEPTNAVLNAKKEKREESEGKLNETSVSKATAESTDETLAENATAELSTTVLKTKKEIMK